MEVGYKPCTPGEATHLLIHFPGPSGTLILPVLPNKEKRSGTGCWSWNGDLEKPTLKPSVRTRGTLPLTDDRLKAMKAGQKVEPEEFTCHSFVTGGMVTFLTDSTHDLAGKTVSLIDVEP